MHRLAVLGLLVSVGFGALWLTWAIKAFGGPHASIRPVYVVAAVMALASLWPTDAPPARRVPARLTKAASLLYVAIVVAEIVALNVMASTLQAHGRLAYLQPAIGLVIGLHFFPLGHLFRMPALRYLGKIMMVAAMLAICAMAIGASEGVAIGADALINGLSLFVVTTRPRLRVSRQTSSTSG